MFGDRPYPHEVVLLFTVGFLIDVLLLLFFFFFFVTRIIWVIASGSRGLDCWCWRC
jgi:flagellar biogenesis protein FliO